MNPLETFKEWYGRQSAEMRSEIAWRVGTWLPVHQDERGASQHMLDPEPTLLGWLDEKPYDDFQLLGKILTLRALVDFAIRNFRTPDDWEIVLDRNKELLARMEEKTGTRDESLRKIITEMPKRANAWVKLSESWRQLTNSSLSDEAIDAWFDETIRENVQQGMGRTKR